MIDAKTLKIFGNSAKIVTGVFIGGLLLSAYRNYFELRKTRLEIELLKRQLAEKK